MCTFGMLTALVFEALNQFPESLLMNWQIVHSAQYKMHWVE